MKNQNQESNRMVLLIAVFFMAVFVSIAAYFLIAKSKSLFVHMQEEMTDVYLDQLEGKLKREFITLSVIVSDWTLWTDMYNFAAAEDEKERNTFIQNEMTAEETFSSIEMDAAVIVGKNGQVIFSKALPDAANESGQVPSPIMDYVLADSMSNYPASNYVKRGIITFANKTFMLASRPITKSDGSGDPPGIFYGARFIKEEYVSGFESVPGFDFAIFPYIENAQIETGGVSVENPTSVTIIGDRSVIGYRFYRNPPAILRISYFPTLINYGVEMTKFIIIVACISFSIGAISLIFFLGWQKPTNL